MQSPFLLGAVLDVHFRWVTETYPHLAETVDIIRRSIYVDDLIAGDFEVMRLKKLKEDAIFIFKEASFELHKWYSNVRELEDVSPSEEGQV